MPSDTKDPNAPETASGKQPKESAPANSDASFPKQRGSDQFGTHGGAHGKPGQSPKAPGTKEK
ncbi:MAG TPA: hypothetical protein VGK67_03740 [Myxococcales bacterium]|jgi:hypothetical protein